MLCADPCVQSSFGERLVGEISSPIELAIQLGLDTPGALHRPTIQSPLWMAGPCPISPLQSFTPPLCHCAPHLVSKSWPPPRQLTCHVGWRLLCWHVCVFWLMCGQCVSARKAHHMLVHTLCRRAAFPRQRGPEKQ